MKGIVLAGGAGSRLDPITRVYYPMSVLMISGIREILLISTPEDTPRFESLLGDGSNWGIDMSYAVQETPGGIAEAFIVGAEFIDSEPVALILGDNIFYGDFGLARLVDSFESGALIFGYPVSDPRRYGVVETDSDGKVLSLEEKPVAPRSNYAIPGFYLYDSRVVDVTRDLEPSPRGELEITDVNRFYMEDGSLRVILLGRGVAWLDSGTHDSLLEAANFIATIEHRQGLKIACLEEVALDQGFVSVAEMRAFVTDMPNSSYREYVEKIVEERRFDK